ncbi:MAG: dihydrofolate reductase family protein, partial [Carboxylicivirga sp.]|nr:dihydrofolate reductase family protein [Carboxylicivirga sp.]
SLTLRDWAGHQPLRCVIDKQLRLGEQCHLIDQKCPTLVFNELKSKTDGLVDFVQVSEDELIDEVLTQLWKREIQSVIIEGGSYTLTQFIQCNLWDEAYRYIGDVNFEKGIQAPKLRILPNNQQQFGSSKLLVYRNNL